jgi:cytochrome c biogenesis protein CcdA
MVETAGIGLVTAFLGGVVSFLSPCVLSVVPGYRFRWSDGGDGRCHRRGLDASSFLMAAQHVPGAGPDRLNGGYNKE